MALFKNVNIAWFTFLNLCGNCRRLHSTYYITTPIFYVNDSPHLGHLYSAVLADAGSRFYNLTHPEESKTLFSTGTDEHGLKIQKAAASKNQSLTTYCDRISSEYKSLFDSCDIKYTNFIRTSDRHHFDTVQHFWTVLQQNGLIYAGNYSGWYCVPDEAYLSDNNVEDVVKENGDRIKISKESRHEVEWIEESNYMFKLSSLVPDIVRWLETDENRVIPSKFRKQLKDWLSDERATHDLSISRPIDRIHWGIPVPGDDRQIIYVWLDALVNYLTVAGYPNMTVWPPTVHVCGKDILKFHGIYWPAFLIGAGLQPPERLFVHSHWTVNNEKMSKSKNNVVNPFEKIREYSPSGLRYFLLREGVPHSNGNYIEMSVRNLLNAELANTLGNLLNRCTAKAVNPGNIFPVFNRRHFNLQLRGSDDLVKLTDRLTSLADEVGKHYADFNFYKGIDLIVSTLTLANKYFTDCKPWELKNENDKLILKCVIHITMETLRICGIGLQPVIPDIADKLLNKLGVAKSNRFWRNMKPSWETYAESTADNLVLNEENVILYKKLKNK